LWEWNPGSFGRDAHVLPYVSGSGDEPGDGHLLVFVSEAPLLPAEDTDTVNDVYRYDDQAGALVCLSCVKDGAFPVLLMGAGIGAEADLVSRTRIASRDGSSVVFATKESLLADDANPAMDAYVWDEDGGLSLLSAATGDDGILADETTTPLITPDKQIVVYATRATLVPQDTNGGGIDYYAARTAGGFAQMAIPHACDISLGACQGTGGATGAPQADAARPTVTVQPSSNVVVGPRVQLTVPMPSRAARRRAARTGMLELRPTSTAATDVLARATARLRGRTRQIGQAAATFTQAGPVALNVKLSTAARAALRRNGRLVVAVRVQAPGARPETLSIPLRRAAK
jgi:hypothetical protein